jgi:hypothetical protein
MKNNTLSERDKGLCTYIGLVGIMLTLTSVIQLFVIADETSTITSIFPIYIYCIVAFSLLIAQHYASPYLLLGSIVGLLIVDIIVAKNGLFSLIIMLLFIYCIITAIFLLMDGLQQRLWKRTLAKRAEDAQWNNKI